MSPKLPLSILTGKTILERWNCDENHLVYILLNGLIHHAFYPDAINSLSYMPGEDVIEFSIENKDHCEPFADLTYSPDDVYSLEKSFPKLKGGKWKEDIISVAELVNTWGRPGIEIIDILSNCKISPVDPTGSVLDVIDLSDISEDDGLVSRLDWLYKRSEVAEVERQWSIKPKASAVKEKKLRHDQQCRKNCREIARLKWDEDPNVTIADMTKDVDIMKKSVRKDGNYFSERVVYDWIRDLCPNPKRGRPKKKKEA